MRAWVLKSDVDADYDLPITSEILSVGLFSLYVGFFFFWDRGDHDSINLLGLFVGTDTLKRSLWKTFVLALNYCQLLSLLPVGRFLRVWVSDFFLSCLPLRLDLVPGCNSVNLSVWQSPSVENGSENHQVLWGWGYRTYRRFMSLGAQKLEIRIVDTLFTGRKDSLNGWNRRF